jgi:hypothetical protein
MSFSSPIPKELLEEILADDFYKECARKHIFNHECRGRITFEHAIIMAGKQLNEKWSLLPICWNGHLGDDMDKEVHEWIALNRATEEDLEKYPKCTKAWKQRLKYLNGEYGEYENWKRYRKIFDGYELGENF